MVVAPARADDGVAVQAGAGGKAEFAPAIGGGIDAAGDQHVPQPLHSAGAGPTERFETESGAAVADDDGTVGVGAPGFALERTTGQVAQSDHPAAASPAERFDDPGRGEALADDDGAVAADAIVDAAAQADHSAARRPAERLVARGRRAEADDDRTVAADAPGVAVEISAGQVAQADHS